MAREDFIREVVTTFLGRFEGLCCAAVMHRPNSCDACLAVYLHVDIRRLRKVLGELQRLGIARCTESVHPTAPPEWSIDLDGALQSIAERLHAMQAATCARDAPDESDERYVCPKCGGAFTPLDLFGQLAGGEVRCPEDGAVLLAADAERRSGGSGLSDADARRLATLCAEARRLCSSDDDARCA